MEKLLKISDLDNVAVALADLKKGEEILFFTNYISDCLLLKREVSESEAREIYKEYFNC